MGGTYAPVIKGEIEGFKIGLDTDLILWEHTRKLNYEKLEGEWLIGFGVGFNKGQNLRDKLVVNASNEELKERIDSVIYLLNKMSYDKFEIALLSNLENLKNWKSKSLSQEVVYDVEFLIKKDKLQRALDRIKGFYENEKVLTALIKYDYLPNRLIKLRRNKQRKEITNTTYLIEKQKIKVDLEKWVKENKTTF